MRENKNNGQSWLAAILVAAFVAFAPSLFNAFVNWDDPVLLLENPYVQKLSWENLAKIFTEEFKGKYYPLTLLTLALEHHVVKFVPFFYHLTNLVLHLANVTLLFGVLKRLKFSTAVVAVTAGLFALHPMQVESVAWVSSRKDLLAMFFALAALKSYISGSRWYVSTGLFVCSLLSKPSAIMLPVLLILLDRYRDVRRPWKDYIPYFASAAMMGALTVHMADAAGGFPATAFYGPIERLLFSAYALSLYLFKLSVPVGLSCYYPLPERAGGFYPMEVYVAIIPVLLALRLLMSVHNKDFRFCAGWFLLMILPVLHFVRINDSIIYERFVYLPSIGVFLGAGLIVERMAVQWQSWKRISVFALMGIWSVMSVVGTWQRCFVWRDGVTLWSNVLEQFTYHPVPYLNRGEAHYHFRWLDAALKDFDAVLRLDPKSSIAHFNKGIIYAERRDLPLALQEYTRAITLDSKDVKAYNNRGNTFSDMGKENLALADYSKVLELDPQNLFACLNRAITHRKLGMHREALADFERALAIDPQNPFAKKMIVDMKNESLDNHPL